MFVVIIFLLVLWNISSRTFKQKLHVWSWCLTGRVNLNWWQVCIAHLHCAYRRVASLTHRYWDTLLFLSVCCSWNRHFSCLYVIFGGIIWWHNKRCKPKGVILNNTWQLKCTEQFTSDHSVTVLLSRHYLF